MLIHTLPLGVALSDGVGIKLVVGMIAWFAQMGFHEGGHAWAAWWLGDDTAYLMGKRTVNPMRHVNWREPMSLLSTLVLPAITSITFGAKFGLAYIVIPMGMAYVPVNIANFRRPLRDHAIVAFAGPAGGFVVALVAFLAHLVLFKTFYGSEMTQMMNLLAAIIISIYFSAIIYSVFNLVPIPPLDGSNILYYFVNWRAREIMDKVRPYGFFIIILLFWIGPGGALIDPVINFLLIPFFVWPARIWGLDSPFDFG
ncbi:MAG: site-2 protease family protein [Planctomycetes bacterium]|nr:site-2 protease family protein [Planctomycetota bacterium]